jgi:nucleoid-associated protein YgaU
MGRLEKIVVLTVLFLVAVVLGVALTPTGEKKPQKEGHEPVQAAGEVQKPIEQPASGTQAPGLLNAQADLSTKAPVVDAKSPSNAIDANVPNANGAAPAQPPVAPAPKPEVPVAKFIMTTEGLEPSNAPDTMFYAWKQGDTFAALAQRYYGSKDKVSRLTKANEGRNETNMKVDERLWIPVAESSTTRMASESGKFYVVKSGDVLSGISQQFYGTSKKWQKILDANRDTLASPEKLKVGMKLRIPE